MTGRDPVSMLSAALEQVAGLLDDVRVDQLTQPTPCKDWTVRELVAHLIGDTKTFVQMIQGEEPDWSVHTQVVDADFAGAFRSGAATLIDAWRQQPEAAQAGADWQTAEYVVHAWDLATAIGRPVEDLDPDLVAPGLAFMRANLTDDNRGGAFGAEQPAPADASPYDQIAAFAGRPV